MRQEEQSGTFLSTRGRVQGTWWKWGCLSFTNQSQTQEHQKYSLGFFLYWFIPITSVAFPTVICSNTDILRSSDSGSIYRFLFFLRRRRDCLTFLFPFKCSPRAWINIICHRGKIYLLVQLSPSSSKVNVCARVHACSLWCGDDEAHTCA